MTEPTQQDPKAWVRQWATFFSLLILAILSLAAMSITALGMEVDWKAVAIAAGPCTTCVLWFYRSRDIEKKEQAVLQEKVSNK